MSAGSLVTIEQGVPAETGMARVRADNGTVTVYWLCGDARTFDPDGLRAAVATIDALAPFPDVTTELRDRNGAQLAVRLVDGELYAENRSHYLADLDGKQSVPWDLMKKAITKAAKQAA